MAPLWRTLGIALGVLVVMGAVAGGIAWAVIASRSDDTQDTTTSAPEVTSAPTETPASTTETPQPPTLRDQEWWEHTVIYQIYPRSFKDSDGDGIGDLRGITSQMEHFVECGVGAIWMSPIFSSPMVDFGYDISDFYDIHYEYGNMADFEDLMEKAQELGIKVLLDYVPNHASTESEYFVRSEAREPGYEDYFVWADPLADPDNATNRLVPSNWISQFGGTVWEWSEARQQYYLHQFAVEQADFNFRYPPVRQEMLNILRFWFEKGVDGFRLDALPHMFEADPADHGGVYPDEPLSGNMFLRPDQPGYTTELYTRNKLELYDVVYEWREFADQWAQENQSETKALLAEAYANITFTMLYYGDEAGRLGAHFPFNFDFITELNRDSNARDFVYQILRWMTYMPKGLVPNWVFGNHDQNRMPSRFRDDMVDGLNALNMMLPGVAITYQGEEIGMRDGYVSWEDTVDVNACNQGTPDNYLEFSRDPARTPYHWDDTTSAGFSTSNVTWLPVAEDYLEINLARQKEETRSHFKVYQSLTSLRRQPALSHGDYHVQALSARTMVLVRHLPTYDTYVLVFNVAADSDAVELTDVALLADGVTMEVYTSSVHSTRLAGATINTGQTLILQAGEALVLRASSGY